MGNTKVIGKNGDISVSKDIDLKSDPARVPLTSWVEWRLQIIIFPYFIKMFPVCKIRTSHITSLMLS